MKRIDLIRTQAGTALASSAERSIRCVGDDVRSRCVWAPSAKRLMFVAWQTKGH